MKTQKFVAPISMSRENFRALFHYLDKHGDYYRHDFSLTRRLLVEHGLPVAEVLDWLPENGVGCDCEVLLNVEEKFA